MSIFNWLFGKKKESSSEVKSPVATAPEKVAHTPKKEVTDLCNKAMAAIERNDISKAFQDLTRAEALDPRDPFVHLLLHQAYGITRDYGSAAKHFQSVRELDPATAEELLGNMPDFLRVKMNSMQNSDENEKDNTPEDEKKRETILYAYLVETQSAGVPGFRQTVVIPAAEEELKQKIRANAKCKDAEVVIISPKEWSPPQFSSVSQQELTSKFPLVMARVQEHMARIGLPKVSKDELICNGSVMPNPVSGKVFFVYKVTQ